MSDKELKILDTFARIIPQLTELEKEKLLSFGEGMAFSVRKRNDYVRTNAGNENVDKNSR